MRVAILSDVHSNLEALEAVLIHALEQQARSHVVLGDIVGYNADPVEVIARLASLPDVTLIAGNHDLAAIGRYDVSIFNPVAAEAIAWTAEALTADARTLLTSLEPKRRAPVGLLVHGSVVKPDIEYVFNAETAEKSFKAEPFDVCFFGHTHMPACYRRDADGFVVGSVLADGTALHLDPGARFMLNPGSVGQPRDRDPRASYGIFDDDAMTITVHRVPYDIERTQQKVRDAGLPGVLADRLSDGR